MHFSINQRIKPILYTDSFFDLQAQNSLDSARVVVPIVIELLEPVSVLDVGCGRGAWLRAFRENKVAVLRGLDGDYVDRSKLYIDPECFTPVDLNEPFRIKENYDLAVCLEVAEHISAKRSRSLISSLTDAAPVVLFSAAVPGQRGQGHVNLQWLNYWRGLFAQKYYRMFDPIRPRIRDDLGVSWWYRQNMVVFANDFGVHAHPQLMDSVVAPNVCEVEWLNIRSLPPSLGVREILDRFPQALWKAIRRQIAGAKRSEDTHAGESISNWHRKRRARASQGQG